MTPLDTEYLIQGLECARKVPYLWATSIAISIKNIYWQIIRELFLELFEEKLKEAQLERNFILTDYTK